MSSTRPLELEYLAPAEVALAKAVGGKQTASRHELRLQVLEATSARFGGFDLATFHETFGVQSKKPIAELMDLAIPVANAIARLPIHHALAISALAREVLHEQDRKSTGAYHTDFRLAMRLAHLAAPKLTHKSKVIDPACGAGILLAALTHAVCGMDRAKTTHWLAHGVCAADLSANSLRASLLSLASFTDDISALKTMRNRWYCGDSLMAERKVWTEMAAEGFDAVIGNPPWEKVKLSKHEFLKSSGAVRNYGAHIEGLDENRFAAQRDKVASYSRQLLDRYPTLGYGEPDLYIAFSDLFFELCKGGGIVVALLPGGLIRSQGTRLVRQKLFNASQNVSVSIIDNRARFFAIDTRFKFLAVALVKLTSLNGKRSPLQILHERGTPMFLETTGQATVGRTALATIRPDLSLPEVRNAAEWRLFAKVVEAGTSWEKPDSEWAPKFCREVDMTKERPKFLCRATDGTVPLIEGRMVQAYRFGAKGHVAGTGRSALWEAYPVGGAHLSPQYWIRHSDIPRANQHRALVPRIGFCDIAGQTNERSLMAAWIPARVICGNKVPTILFPEDPSEERLWAWLAVANSFAFDWLLRRVLTTTVNYFLLQSIPLPKLTKGGLPWKKLVETARELHALDDAGVSRATQERIARLRGEADAEVAVAYGVGLKEMELVFKDFPLLDRGQPALPGDNKSTITRDTVLAALAKRTSTPETCWQKRVNAAREMGALPYIPSELATVSKTVGERGAHNHA